MDSVLLLEKDYSSTLCSITCTTPFTWIWNFLKWLFCCAFTSIKSDSAFEVDPSTLSHSDPFRKQVFLSDGTLRAKNAFEKTSQLFQIIGIQSYWRWIPQVSYITELENEIKNIPVHPLEQLFFLFCNKAKTAQVSHFEAQSLQGSWLLKIKTGRAPWEEFINKQVKIFTKKEREIASLLPGFCQALKLDQKALIPLVSQRNWAEFVCVVFKQRKKHFNL